jgi:hypothetical protein
MRKIILALLLTGCANIGIMSDDMQPDGTYKIRAGGNAIASDAGKIEAAHQHAKRLCPTGYDVKSSFEGTLIVKCRP